jgi:hypothetical protein
MTSGTLRMMAETGFCIDRNSPIIRVLCSEIAECPEIECRPLMPWARSFDEARLPYAGGRIEVP